MTVKRSCARTGGLAGLAAAVLLVTGMPGTAAAAEARPGSAPQVTIERGNALSCSGEAGGVAVSAELYENSAHGSHASIRVETAEGVWFGGYGPEHTGIFRQGRVAASVALTPREGGEAAAVDAAVTGTYARAGKPTRVHEVVEDAGKVIVTDGLNTRLTVHATATAFGQRVPLTCDTAFAFDLVVRTRAAV